MMLTSTKSKVLTFSLLPIVLIIVGVATFLLARGWPAPHPLPIANVMPINPAIEDRWGVRVSQVGVTADGGLVDFRFVVLNSDKALAMLDDLKNTPVLVVEDSGEIVNSTALMAHKHTLNPGETYFLLYRNTHGAIKSGTPVTVKFGELSLEHVIAK
jgi:hypothetical protein